jgi:hypothetical protein
MGSLWRTLIASATFALIALLIAVIALRPQVDAAVYCWPKQSYWVFYSPDHKALFSRNSTPYCVRVGTYSDGDAQYKCTAGYTVSHYGFNENTGYWYWSYTSYTYKSCYARVENSSGSW